MLLNQIPQGQKRYLLLKENICVFAESKVVKDFVKLDLGGHIDHRVAAGLERLGVG